jgi:hypothetical protein
MAKVEKEQSLAQRYFGCLSDKDFVNLAKELLEKKGFTDLEKIDGPGDRGTDIIGDETINTGLGKEKRRCLIQCKHYVKSGASVSDEEIRMVAGSLSQRNCESALVITSTTLSPPAKHSVRHFRETDGIPFYYWDAEHLTDLINDENYREIIMKYCGGLLVGAVVRNIRELEMSVAVFSGSEAIPVDIDFSKFSPTIINGKKVTRLSQYTFEIDDLKYSFDVKLSQFGGTDYFQDDFRKKYALFLYRKERLLAQELIDKYISEGYNKSGNSKQFLNDTIDQQEILEWLMSPPLGGALYEISWKILDQSTIYKSLDEIKNALCSFIIDYLNISKSTEWFVLLCSNPVASCFVENASRLRSSVIVLPEYKNFFDSSPTDNHWIGILDGRRAEKSEWLFGLASSFKEHGLSASKIDPKLQIEAFISITDRTDIPRFYEHPMTYADLCNIPDLKARWFLNNIFYLKQPNIDEKKFKELITAALDGVIAEVDKNNVSRIILPIPSELKDIVSEFIVNFGDDIDTNDHMLWNFCKEKQIVNQAQTGSVFLMLSFAFRTKLLDPSYSISEKLSMATNKIAAEIEAKILSTLQIALQRGTTQRREIYYDYHNNYKKAPG